MTSVGPVLTKARAEEVVIPRPNAFVESHSVSQHVYGELPIGLNLVDLSDERILWGVASGRNWSEVGAN
jgi:hypothetical protein